MVDFHRAGNRAYRALPEDLRERDHMAQLTDTLAHEVLEYGAGLINRPSSSSEDDTVRLILEDLESIDLLSDFLATDVEEEEIDPETLRHDIMARANEIASSIKAGETLQNLIREELADTDCGACDHPTCDEYSVALADGSDADNTKCEPGGPKVTAQVELVMEVDKGTEVDPDKIIAIAAQAKDEPSKASGLQVLQLGSARGMPAVVLSLAYPDASFHIIDADTRRVWFLKRLVNLLGVRNCRVHVGRPEQYYDEFAGSFDLVLIKHEDIQRAAHVAIPFTRPGGQIINWKGVDWSDAASDYQHGRAGTIMPLQAPRYFTSEPIARQVLLLLRRPDEPEVEESAPAKEASTEAPVAEVVVTAAAPDPADGSPTAAE